MPATALGLNVTHGETTFADFVLQHLAIESALLRGGARFVPIGGRSAKIPRVLSDGAASWCAEGTEIPSDAPEGDILELVPRKVANVVSLSSESIADSGIGELDAVGNALTRSVAVATDARAFSTEAPTAIAPGGLLPGLPTGIGPVSLDNIVRAVGAVESVGGVASTTWLHPSDLTDLRLVKTSDTDSNMPVLQPDLQAGGAERVAGTVLIPTPALPVGKAIVADASQIVVGYRTDVSVEFSEHSKFTADSVVARVICRLDWAANDVSGIVLLQDA
jgi:HK97 family phage major capsid protein